MGEMRKELMGAQVMSNKKTNWGARKTNEGVEGQARLIREKA